MLSINYDQQDNSFNVEITGDIIVNFKINLNELSLQEFNQLLIKAKDKDYNLRLKTSIYDFLEIKKQNNVYELITDDFYDGQTKIYLSYKIVEDLFDKLFDVIVLTQ